MTIVGGGPPQPADAAGTAMEISGIVFTFALIGVVLFSSIVLIRQFVRGIAAERRTVRWPRRTYAPVTPYRSASIARRRNAKKRIERAISHALHAAMLH